MTTDQEKERNAMLRRLPSLGELAALLRSLKANIGDDYRASDDPEDDAPGMCVTVGWSPESGDWSYQTGDNSFTGGAYRYPHWGVISLYRRSNSRDLARDIQDQLAECVSF